MPKRFPILTFLLALSSSTAWASTPTYSHDIEPIVTRNCLACHQSGEVAPFALSTFNDVKKRAEQIVEVTGSRFMPPWKPEPGFGHFVGERRLTEDQIKSIAAWTAAGCPEGEKVEPATRPSSGTGWANGTPDLIVKMPGSYTLHADGDNGRDAYRAFVIPLHLAEDQYVTAVEFHPDNRRIVHHALFFLDNTGAAAKKEANNKDGQIGYGTFGGPGFLPSGGLGGWAPGAMSNPLPAGWGKMLRRGSDLVMQIHFHPSGKQETEQASLGIYFAKARPERIVAGAAARSFWINIAPGDSNYIVKASYTVPVDVDLIGITPHAHLLCKDMKATARLPDGTVKNLIWIKDWDFAWQGQYRYAERMRLPAGTLVSMVYTYDNSDRNPRNPSTPPKRVHFGEQTVDEMAILFLEFSPVNRLDWLNLLKTSKPRFNIGAAFGGQN